MFEAWGRALYARRRLTLGITLVLVAFAAVWGTGVFGKLSSGDNFTRPLVPWVCRYSSHAAVAERLRGGAA